ncbi:acyl carrier protein [Sphingomonas sp. BGYR3]|uniref:acyl carrier protein n=1 Tax=Sphingomonas sp. BGYR3 TaxID=2975483 RepID=UPI0021A49BBB|nr:acyl carrier protein [Sphingomonas sp. BGYR3]MDG5489252.1 acyl carrier protein [Sphingomonas sp. BGYR3]
MSTVERLIPIVAKQLGRDPGEFSASTDLQEAGYESLDVIETIFAIEEEFGIDVNYNANVDDPDKLRTIGDLATMVDEAVAAKGAQ